MECIYETSQMAKSFRDISGTRKTTLANSGFELTPLAKNSCSVMLSSWPAPKAHEIYS